MESIYRQSFSVNDAAVDCFGRLKLSMALYYAQEVAGQHFSRLVMDQGTLAQRGLFWALTRIRVQITRLPRSGETIQVQTWPMPTTRVAYPRFVQALDEQGRELFRIVSLWVLMDLESRSLVLPGRSGIQVQGQLLGSELALPGSIALGELENCRSRCVCFTDLDCNGHMNNTRYLDWACDLLPSAFHRDHSPRELIICYHTEAREGQTLELCWEPPQEGLFQLEGRGPGGSRVFSLKLLY